MSLKMLIPQMPKTTWNHWHNVIFISSIINDRTAIHKLYTAVWHMIFIICTPDTVLPPLYFNQYSDKSHIMGAVYIPCILQVIVASPINKCESFWFDFVGYTKGLISLVWTPKGECSIHLQYKHLINSAWYSHS